MLKQLVKLRLFPFQSVYFPKDIDTDEEENHEKYCRITHASRKLVDSTVGNHTNNNANFFGNVKETKERGRIFCFGQIAGIGRAGHRLYTAHDKPDQYRREVKMDGFVDEISNDADSYPYKIEDYQGGNIPLEACCESSQFCSQSRY